MDDYASPAITIEIKTKCAANLGTDPCSADGKHTDAFNVVHAATDGTITDKTVGHFL